MLIFSLDRAKSSSCKIAKMRRNEEELVEFTLILFSQHTNTNNQTDSEDSDDDAVDALADPSVIIKLQQGKQSRTSVSAEVYGSYNKKSDFIAKNIKKNEDQIARIKQRLSTAFMFQSLDEQEQKVVIGAMEEKKFK